MIKSLFRLSLRMVTGFVQSLIKLCGLNWTAPDYSTLCRRQKHIDIAISYQKSSDGLHLLVDSTGLKFLGEGLIQTLSGMHNHKTSKVEIKLTPIRLFNAV